MLIFRKLGRQNTYFIGTTVVLGCVCVFIFLFTDASLNAKEQRQPFLGPALISRTTDDLSVENISRKNFSKTNKHNKHISYPWLDDSSCKHFTVQV